MNKTILKGRLTADPELKQTASGISACRFTLAVDRKFKDKDGERKADFISCVAWRQTAEFICKYFFKGSMMLCEGALQTGSYEKDGVKHYTTDVNVEAVEFCESKNTQQSSAPQPSSVESLAKNAQAQGVEVATDLSEFEEILSDGEVPF